MNPLLAKFSSNVLMLPSVKGLQDHWATHLQADVADIAFMEQFSLALWKRAADPIDISIKPHSASGMESVPRTSHLLIRSRPNHRRHQHVRPDTPRDLSSPYYPHALCMSHTIGYPFIVFYATSLATSAFEVPYSPSHSASSWYVLSCDAILTVATICEDNMKKKNDRDWHQLPLNPGLRFAKNWRFYNSRQRSSYSSRTLRVLPSADNAPNPEKN